MKNMIKYTLLFSICLGLSATVNAQLGVNNPNPDPSSVLDVSANNRGVLIPRMTTGLRQAMAIGTPVPAQGLLVFDTDQNRIYFWDGSAWETANPMKVDSTGSNEILRIATEMTLGAGYVNTAAPNNGLIVEGQTGIGTASLGTDQLTVSGTTNLQGNVGVTGNVNATGTVTATNYAVPSGSSTNSPVPSGGIIMWSGSVASIPAGWALCDGTGGTPDLRDRFVVGAGSSYTVNATGGSTTHSHTTGIDGAHTHPIYGQTGLITTTTPIDPPTVYTALDDFSGWTGDAYLETHTNSTQQEGNHAHVLDLDTDSDGAHNHSVSNANHLPPYLALAYIMKL